MNAHTAEQAALVDSVRALLDRRADSAAVRAADGFDEPLWKTLTEQIGVAALMVPEEHGGAGGSLVEAALVLEELGRALAPVPMLGSVVAAAATDDPALLERIAGGEVATVAPHADERARGSAARQTTNALISRSAPTLYGAEASIVLTVGDSAVAVADSWSATGVPALDPTIRLATVEVTAERAIPGDPLRAHSAALVGACALAVGCAQRGLDMTVAYTKQRHQFGRPIGSFQALKHRMADMLVLVEMSRSATRAAAAGELDAGTAAAYTLPAALKVAGETIQLHGGIAITWEHDAHLVLKRAHALHHLFTHR